MGKCFITKLPSSLKPNPNLRTFNSIRLIEVSPLAQGVEPTYDNSAVADFIHVLKFKSYDKDGNLVYENKSAGGGMQPANVKYIELLDKDKTYGPSFLGRRFQYEDSLSTLCKLKNIRYIISRFSKNNVDCTLSEVSTLTNLTQLDLSKAAITGNISSLSTLTNLTQLALNDTAITGDISSLSTLTNLTQLWLSGTPITGDISNLIDKLTKLKTLAIPSTVTITDAQKKTLTDRGCTVTIA